MRIFILNFIFLCLGVTQLVNAQTTVNMPGDDGGEKTVAVTDPITFYDAGGESGDIPIFKTTGITFTPRDGELIKIVFETIDLQGGALIELFDGEVKLDSYWDDFNQEYTYNIPSGSKLSLTGSLTNQVYSSTSFDGKVTVCFTNSNGSGSGWKATVTSEERPPVTEEPAPNPSLLSALPKLYAVSSPVDFYDDGGKDGNISENFEGYVTFKPTSAGKKIKITFNNLDLFNTYTPKNDKLKVYSGMELNEDNLEVTLLKQQTPYIVKSTSDDGAMTVYLKSITGVTKSGFEAVVTEYAPGPMTYVSTTLAQITEGTVAGGDTNQEIMSVNISTDNNQSPLTASSFNFNSNGTFAAISKATLYYTQSTNEFSTTKKVGEVNVTADDFIITCTTPQELIEGSNYFWLAYDIKPDAANDALIDATCTSVTLSDGEHIPANTTLDGNRVVKNIYYSTIGSHEKTVYGSIEFTHTPASSYSSRYKAEKGEQKVTFKPSDETSNKIKIDFADFDIYYSSSSYGTKAKFKIYNGSETTADNLLWEVDADNKSTGPGKAISSSAADGSLTVVFDANTTMSYHTADGWHATVSEFTPEPMQLKEVTAFQLNTGDVGANSVNQEILGVEVTTEGILSPISLSEIAVNLKGSEQNVEKVSVFYTGNEKVFSNAAENLVGSNNQVNTETVVSLSTVKTLPEGKSYFWVTYDVKADATANSTLDAALVSVKSGTTELAPIVADPDGERTIKLIYNFKGGNETVNITAPLKFYDNGGKDSHYTKDAKGTVTFNPTKAGDVIKIIYKKFKTHYNDHLYIYNGNSTEGEELVDVKGSYYTDFGEVMSTAADGSLTVAFSPKKESPKYFGWEFDVISYTPKPLSLESIVSTKVSDEGLLRNTKDNLMLRVAIEVSGDKGNMNIQELVFNATGTTNIADITKANVYYTDSLDSFSGLNVYGTSTTAPFTFTGTAVINKPGTYYLWLTYDISLEAAIDNTINAELTSIKVDDANVSITENNSATATIIKGFSGTYTVGTTTSDYATFADAIKAMERGVDGPVVFNVENGTYSNNITIPHIKGTSSVNTILFKSTSGSNTDVVIENNNFNSPGGSGKYYGLLTVDGADYITFDGFSIKSTDTDYDALVRLGNMSNNVVFKNCVFEAPMYTSYTNNSNLFETYAENKANKNSNNLTIENCNFIGGYIALDISGTGYVALPKQYGFNLHNCTFTNQGSKSIYLHNLEQVSVVNNSISNTETTKRGFQAMDLYRCQNGVLISNNRISLETQENSVGIELRPVKGVVDNPAMVVNNEIMFPQVNGLSKGFIISDKSDYVKIAYNSVFIKGKSELSVALFSEDNNTNISVINNLFQNLAEGRVYFVKKEEQLSGISFSHNGIFTNAADNVAYIPSDKYNKEDWITKSGAVNLVFEQAEFFSEASLALKVVGGFNSAEPLGYVTKDINGVDRNDATPTIGAYEYEEPVAPAMAEGYPKVTNINHESATVQVKLVGNGKFYYIVKAANEDAPTKEELKAATMVELAKNTEKSVSVTSLEANTEYKLYYLLVSYIDIETEVEATDSFRTNHLPTQVSTFENVTVASGDFTDGTADFKGFVVVDITDGVGADNKKAAKINNPYAEVTINNTDNGLTVNGFFIKSDVSTVVACKNLQGTFHTFTVKSTEGKWRYVSLKKKGKVTSVQLSATGGNVFIDNFSGMPASIKVTLENVKINEGEQAVVNPQITGGVMPYTYSWINAKHTQLAETATLTVTPECTSEYYLTVTDAWDTVVESSVLVEVTGKQVVATFDDLYLAEESQWSGQDNTSPTGYSTFYSGSFSFLNNFNKEYLSWSGFAYSNMTATTFNMSEFLTDQFRSAVGHGVDDSKNYAVCYTYGATKVSQTNSDEAQEISGFYITNTAWVKHCSENGTGMDSNAGNDANKPFTTGDWFKITATGDNGNKVEFYLADYRSDDVNKHYTLDSWQWFDLRALGKVKYVTFKADGTRKNTYGSTIPFYFCADNFGGVRNISDGAAQTVSEGKSIDIDPASLFTEVNASADYYITDVSDAKVAETAIVDNSTLNIKGVKKGSTEFVIKQTIKGKSIFVKVKVNVTDPTAINNLTGENNIRIYPNPASDFIKLNVAGDVEVYSVNGMLIKSVNDYQALQNINVSDLKVGVYIVKIKYNNSNKTVRFIKK